MKIFVPFLGMILLNASIYAESNAIDIAKELLRYGEHSVGSVGHDRVLEGILRYLSISKVEVERTSWKEDTPNGELTFHNIWGTIPARGKSEKTIVLATHYDSKYFPPPAVFYGADDGISSTALLLSLLPKVKRLSLKNTTVIMLFLDGEEAFAEWSSKDSLYGSRHQARYWAEKGLIAHISQFILLDMVGGKDPHFCYEAHSDRELSRKIFNLADELNIPYFDKGCSNSVDDDHLPFFEKDVPVIDIITTPFPDYWHTTRDTYDKLSVETLNNMEKLVGEYIRREDLH